MKGKVENVSNIDNSIDIVNFAKNMNIDLVCIGPEQPLVDGLCDLMLSNVSYIFILIFLFYFT